MKNFTLVLLMLMYPALPALAGDGCDSKNKGNASTKSPAQVEWLKEFMRVHGIENGEPVLPKNHPTVKSLERQASDSTKMYL
jgi:hypothetical protein